jgi:cytochrome bd-type quinol oxidase subunit 2
VDIVGTTRPASTLAELVGNPAVGSVAVSNSSACLAHLPRSVQCGTETSAPAASLQFLLPGVLLLVPVILLYTLYGYRVFSGKVRPEEND